MKKTAQEEIWQGDFGRQYTQRCFRTADEADDDIRALFGVARTEMNAEFLGSLDRSTRILEVGANVGIQLLHLRRVGFERLYGIEIQTWPFAVTQAPEAGISLLRASGFQIPFPDAAFDIVFTSGVLIHISPANLPRIMSEMYRCSRRYIWGFEYFSEQMTEVDYRGHSGLLWKGDYSAEFRRLFPDLRICKEKRFKYLDNDNEDCMYLLEKESGF